MRESLASRDFYLAKLPVVDHKHWRLSSAHGGGLQWRVPGPYSLGRFQVGDFSDFK